MQVVLPELRAIARTQGMQVAIRRTGVDDAVGLAGQAEIAVHCLGLPELRASGRGVGQDHARTDGATKTTPIYCTVDHPIEQAHALYLQLVRNPLLPYCPG